MTMKYLAVIECTDAGGVEIGSAILKMGFQPIFFLNPTIYKADLEQSLQNFEFKIVDTSSINAICDEIVKFKDQIIGVTTLVDSKLAITSEVAKKLNIKGPDQACILLKDKAEVAKIIQQNTIKTYHLTSNIETNKKIVEKLKGVDLVAKRKLGCGAVGIQFLSTDIEKTNFINTTSDPTEWILQEKFNGSLFSLEGWVQNGHINYVGWTSRKKICNTETEFRFEGYESIPSTIDNLAKAEIQKLFTGANFQRGWFHIEFIVNDSKTDAVMIDANIGRVGGAMLPHVLAMALNITPAQLYQHVIETQVNGSSSIKLPKINNQEKIYKCICFGSPEETIIEQVLLPESPLNQPGIRVTRILGRGDRVSKIGHDDWSWVGFVAGEESLVDHYAAKIKIQSHTGDLYPAAF